MLEAHVAVVRTILETCGPGYAAVWLPDGADSSSLTWEGGPLTPAMAATWPRDGRLDAVQAPITDVLEEQVRMARSIETSA